MVGKRAAHQLLYGEVPMVSTRKEVRHGVQHLRELPELANEYAARRFNHHVSVHSSSRLRKEVHRKPALLDYFQNLVEEFVHGSYRRVVDVLEVEVEKKRRHVRFRVLRAPDYGFARLVDFSKISRWGEIQSVRYVVVRFNREVGLVHLAPVRTFGAPYVHVEHEERAFSEQPNPFVYERLFR